MLRKLIPLRSPFAREATPLQGIHGWLAVFVITAICSIAIWTVELALVVSIIRSHTHDNIILGLVFMALGLFALALGEVYGLRLMARNHPQTRRFFLVWIPSVGVISLALLGLDTYLAILVADLSAQPMAEHHKHRNLALAMFCATFIAGWEWYWLTSRRVQRTFQTSPQEEAVTITPRGAQPAPVKR